MLGLTPRVSQRCFGSLAAVMPVLAASAIVGLGGVAVADSRPAFGVPECVSPERGSEAVQSKELLDSRLKGLALADLAKVDEAAFPESWSAIGQARMVDAAVRAKGVIEMNEILSTSLVSQEIDHWVVDVLGRHPRFSDHDTKRHKMGRVGLVRVRVPVGHLDGISDVGAPEVMLERSFSELRLSMEVSITDWVAIVDDKALGFRRIYPLGGGGIDRGVRVVGVTTSLTPTTEDGLLEKKYAYRELDNPWYFKKKPYLPISVSFSYKRADGSVHKFYKESNIAFHIWQAKGFERGYFSRGCMRMRTEDLMEMAAFVFSSDKPIPVAVRMPQRPDVHHPFPLAEHYYEMVNIGTPQKPRYQLEWGQLYKTAPGTTPLPKPEELIPLDFREKVVKPAEPAPTTTDAAPGTSSERP